MPAINPQTSVFTPIWSRNLGAVFRSPVTTLAHHYEVIAPDLRLRFHAEFSGKPVNSELPRSVWFRSHKRGAIFVPNLLPVPSFGALAIFPGLHSPSGLFRTLWIKAFSRYPHQKPASRFTRLSSAPRRALFQLRFGSSLETPLRFVWLSRKMTTKLGELEVTDVDDISAVCKPVSGAGFKIGDVARTVTQ